MTPEEVEEARRQRGLALLKKQQAAHQAEMAALRTEMRAHILDIQHSVAAAAPTAAPDAVKQHGFNAEVAALLQVRAATQRRPSGHVWVYPRYPRSMRMPCLLSMKPSVDASRACETPTRRMAVQTYRTFFVSGVSVRWPVYRHAPTRLKPCDHLPVPRAHPPLWV
jgi:hypothetical protein